MKIATITCHDVYNYGASLQAYALQEYCKSLGCDYEIIDYKPDYLSQHFKLTTIANPRFDHPIIRQLYLLAKLPGRIRDLKKKRAFDEFTAKYLIKTRRRYGSFEDLHQNPPSADIYIAGSDQIWNTFFKNGHDKAFYLAFASRAARRVSFAASFATDSIYGGAEEFVKTQLHNFDAISVRETSALTLLQKLGRDDGRLVCDPVFLLPKAQWEKLIRTSDKPAEDYIVVYDCEQSKALREIALELSKQTGLPIHSLATTAGRYAKKDISLGGPLDFLKEIGEARYVLANSFHALAFSLIFHKDFFIVNRSEKINTRMRDVLSYLGLEKRLISAPCEANATGVDFGKADSKLSELITQSKLFIDTQISHVK